MNTFTSIVTECQRLSIKLQVASGDSDLYLSVFNQTNYIPMYTEGRTYDAASWFLGDDFILISVCPLPGQAASPVIITVQLWSVDPSNTYQLLFTSEIPWIYRPIVELSPYAAFFEMGLSSRLHVLTSRTNGTLVSAIGCFEQATDCQHYWQTFPS
jgi:hypothetical protein